MTLRELIAEHPEWADLPIVVPAESSRVAFDYIGQSGLVYIAEDFDGDEGTADNKRTVLVFAPN